MCLENQGFKCWVDFLSNFVLNTCMREKGHADACNEDASEGSRSKQNTRRPAPLLWDRKNKVSELQGGNQSHTHSRSGSSAAFHQAQVRIWSVTVACSFSSFFVLSWSAGPGSWENKQHEGKGTWKETGWMVSEVAFFDASRSLFQNLHPLLCPLKLACVYCISRLPIKGWKSAWGRRMRSKLIPFSLPPECV